MESAPIQNGQLQRDTGNEAHGQVPQPLVVSLMALSVAPTTVAQEIGDYAPVENDEERRPPIRLVAAREFADRKTNTGRPARTLGKKRKPPKQQYPGGDENRAFNGKHSGEQNLSQ